MRINPRFTFDTVNHDRDNDLHLVVDLVAPKSEWQAKRPALCIIPVVDRSGSMDGSKLHYAKQSLLKLVEHLTEEDYFGLVSFENKAHPDAKPQLMTAARKDEMRTLIGRYQTAGSTALSAGLTMALKMANDMDLPESTLVRVIVFTDGQPNIGVTDAKSLCDLTTKQMGRATVSTFGYGTDACQELLQEMSTVGKGNFAFVRDPDSALTAFGKELGGLLSTYGQNLTVTLTPRSGHQLKEVLTDADVEEEIDGQVSVKIPQILSEETVSVVLSTTLKKQKSSGPRQVNVFDVKVSYQVLDSEGNLVTKVEETKAKIQFVKPGEEQTRPTREVDEIVARAQLLKTQIAAEEAAKQGNFSVAASVLRSFQVDANDRGHANVASIGTHLMAMYSDNSTYGSTAGKRSSLRKVMTRGMSSSAMDADDQLVLASAGYVTTNSVQAHFEEAFADNSEPVEPAPTLNPAPVPVQTSGYIHIVGGTPAVPNGTAVPSWVGGLGSTTIGGVDGISVGIGTDPAYNGWNGPLPVGQLPPGQSTTSNRILIAPVVEEQTPAKGKPKRKKATSSAPKSGVKKSRSQRW